jgi:type II secretory pathway pseudopilin PulG
MTYSANKLHSESGLTIVELLIAIVITAALSTVILNFSIDSFRTSAIQTAKQNLLDDARSGLDTVANDIRISTVADTNNRWPDDYAPSAPSDELSWASGAQTLVLASSAIDKNNAPIFDDALNYITAKNNLIFYVKSGTLYRRTLAAPVANNAIATTCPPQSATASCHADKAILRNVSSFHIRYISSDDTEVSPSEARAIELSVTLTDKIFKNAVSSSYTTRMVFRNG